MLMEVKLVSVLTKSDVTNNLFSTILQFIKCFNPIGLVGPKSLSSNSPGVTEPEGRQIKTHLPRFRRRAELRAESTTSSLWYSSHLAVPGLPCVVRVNKKNAKGEIWHSSTVARRGQSGKGKTGVQGDNSRDSSSISHLPLHTPSTAWPPAAHRTPGPSKTVGPLPLVQISLLIRNSPTHPTASSSQEPCIQRPRDWLFGFYLGAKDREGLCSLPQKPPERLSG